MNKPNEKLSQVRYFGQTLLVVTLLERLDWLRAKREGRRRRWGLLLRLLNGRANFLASIFSLFLSIHCQCLSFCLCFFCPQLLLVFYLNLQLTSPKQQTNNHPSSSPPNPVHFQTQNHPGDNQHLHVLIKLLFNAIVTNDKYMYNTLIRPKSTYLCSSMLFRVFTITHKKTNEHVLFNSVAKMFPHHICTLWLDWCLF